MCRVIMKKHTFLRALGIILLFYLFVLIFDGTISKNLEIGKRFLQEQVKYGNFLAKVDKNEIPDNENFKKLPKILHSENQIKNMQVQRKIEEKKPKQSKNLQNKKNKQKFVEKEIGKNNKKISKKQKVQAITNDLKIILKNILKRSFHDNEHIQCKKGHYLLNGMKECKPWLTCKEINNQNTLQKKTQLGGGVGKIVFHGLVHGKHSVAIVTSRRPDRPSLAERVKRGNRNLLLLQPSPFVIQVVGYCEQGSNSTIITESCDSCLDLLKVRKRHKDSFKTIGDQLKLQWLIQIIGGLDLLHNSMELPRVHCDLHTPDEFLTQYILLEDGHVVMSDVDELPEVDPKNKTTCGEERNGIMKVPEFIAPEQRYTEHEYKQYKSRKPITEKSDIWKIPDIAKTIMKDSDLEKQLMKDMDNIHSKCKNKIPKLRPSARTILIEYLKYYKLAFL